METHLKGFGLENFRVFKDYTWFDFAPITILTGPNNSGKSSLNKALKVVCDPSKANEPDLQLGGFERITHKTYEKKSNSSDDLLFKISCPYQLKNYPTKGLETVVTLSLIHI